MYTGRHAENCEGSKKKTSGEGTPLTGSVLTLMSYGSGGAGQKGSDRLLAPSVSDGYISVCGCVCI